MYRSGPRLFWPIILIGIGVVFLLNNLGVIQDNPWVVIWRLWPLLLIALGLEIMLGRRSGAGSIVSAVLGLAVVAFVLWILIARPNLPGLSVGTLTSTPINYPVKEIRSASISISFSAGTNELRALSNSDNLIEGTIQHYGDLTFDASDAGSQASVRISSNRNGIQFPIFVGGDSAEHWDVGLNPSVAYDLDLNMGVGQSTLDLSKLTMTGGRISAGVGTTDLRLPTKGRFVMSIDGGVGTVRIRLPSSIAARVEVDTGIGSFNAGARLRSVANDVYETDGFASADDAITLRVKAGVGTISVIDGE